MIVKAYRNRKRGNHSCYPSHLRGLRIAQLSRRTTQKPTQRYISSHLVECHKQHVKPQLAIIYQPWAFTVVLSFDSFRDLRSFEGQRQAFGKRPFHKDCTRHSAPCGASATECNCKYTAFICFDQMFWRLFNPKQLFFYFDTT